jgi:uncharacterized damage-inducible protein DinB
METTNTLASTVCDELIRYYRHLASRVEKAMRAIPREKVYVKPFPFGNSLGHLVIHLTGNLNHYIGAGIASTGYVRNRPLEFTEPSPPPPEDVLKRFQEAVDMVVRTLQSQTPEDWQKPVRENEPIQTRFGMFLVCAAHMNNHIGQMAWLVQQLGCSTNEPPVW